MESEKLYKEIFEFTADLLDASLDVKLKASGFSMYPLIKPGDIITVRRAVIEELQPGAIIVFKREGNWIAHRIKKITTEGNKRIFITKGDSNFKSDAPVPEEIITGRIVSISRDGNEFNTGEKNKRNNRSVFSNTWLAVAMIKLRLGFVRLTKKGLKHLKGTIENLKFLTLTSKKIFRINLIVSLIQGVLPLLIIYLIKWLVDLITRYKGLTTTTADYSLIFYVIAFISLVFLIQSVLSVYNGIIREKLSQSLSKYVFGLVQQKHTSLDMEHLEDVSQQNKIHKALQEAGFRPNKLVNQYLTLLQALVSFVFICFLLFTIHWSVFFLVLISVIPGFLVRVKYSQHLYGLNKANTQKEREGLYYHRVLTGFSFAKELRLFGLRDFFMNRFEDIQDEIHQKKNRLMRKHLLPDILSQIFAASLMFLSFGFVVYLAVKGLVSFGTIILFFLIFQRGYAVMKDIFQSVAGLIEDNIFLQDFRDFILLPAVHKPRGFLFPPEALRQGIKFEEVSFRYPSSQREALRSVSVEIPKGKTIALVGANGSGKTTFIKLLCGFYEPSKGQILYDGVDISEMDTEILRKQFTAVFQDFALYNLTAAENILLGDVTKTATSEEIKKAAKEVGIADALEALPYSYRTMLGNLFEKGEGLSIGQWQKMALAKAFYRNSPILLLDEPSSALDAEMEAQLLQNLAKLKEEKTVVIVSHRFSTVRWADIIYVMDEGQVSESGSHEELMSAKGKYFEMFNAGNR